MLTKGVVPQLVDQLSTDDFYILVKNWRCRAAWRVKATWLSWSLAPGPERNHQYSLRARAVIIYRLIRFKGASSQALFFIQSLATLNKMQIGIYYLIRDYLR